MSARNFPAAPVGLVHEPTAPLTGNGCAVPDAGVNVARPGLLVVVSW